MLPFAPAQVQLVLACGRLQLMRAMRGAAGKLAEANGALGGDFLMLWSFLCEFAPLLGVPPQPLPVILHSVVVGSTALPFINMHIGMLRFIQAEAEVAHAVTSHPVCCLAPLTLCVCSRRRVALNKCKCGLPAHLPAPAQALRLRCVQAGSSGPGAERATQANVRAAALVTEAHAWGLDMPAWRAHLNLLTWPEVLRQLALAAGWGPRRCRPAKKIRHQGDFALGEDVIEGPDGTLEFRWPSRFQPNPGAGEHTMKEACWKVRSALPRFAAQSML